MSALSWLPADDFNNNGRSLDGYPLFLNEEPFEIIWSYKDNTRPTAQKMDEFYETKSFGSGLAGALLGIDYGAVTLGLYAIALS